MGTKEKKWTWRVDISHFICDSSLSTNFNDRSINPISQSFVKKCIFWTFWTFSAWMWAKLRWLTTVFQRLVARAMIACQTSVLIAHAQMMQATLRRNENHFSTWKALNPFGIRSNSFKLCLNMCLSLEPQKYDRKTQQTTGKRALNYSCFRACDTWCPMSTCLNKGHAQFNSRPRL